MVEQIVRRVCVSAARGTKGRLLMTIHKFTARFVETAKDGMYCDGGNLWLQVRNGGKARAYLFRYTSPVTGAERSMGLGSARTISLAEVREAAHRQHQFLRDGKDPIEVAKIERLERDAKTGGNSSMISHARAGAHCMLRLHSLGPRVSGQRYFGRVLQGQNRAEIGQLPQVRRALPRPHPRQHRPHAGLDGHEQRDPRQDWPARDVG